MIRALDLCCGAGGWACAARGLPVSWVAVADHAADCLETWALNHGQAHPDCALLCVDLSAEAGMGEVLSACRAAGGVDLIVGGIPCEQVSTARGSRAVAAADMDRLHALIDQCFRAVRELRPRWWCYEDVEAIGPHLPPPLECGLAYDVRRVRAERYGPQARRRVFIGEFPRLAGPEPGPRTLGEVLRPGPYRTMSGAQAMRRSRSKWYASDTCRELASDRPGPTVTSAPGQSSDNERGFLVLVDRRRRSDAGRPARTIVDAKQGDAQQLVRAARVQDAGRACPTIADFSSRHERGALIPSAQRRTLAREAPAPTVTASHGCDPRVILPPSIQDGLVRVMEWQEAAMLQGFPVEYVFAASWSRTWKLVAQAIPIQVGRAIMRGVVSAAKGAAGHA